MNPIFSRCAPVANASRKIYRRCNSLTSFLLLVAALAISSNLSAQTQLSRPNLNILSPQTYEFVRYGNVPVSYFTGEANIQIPIYTYKDKDFELPISLGYNSSGFMPSKRENIVGLNWYLTGAGGAITRKINGVADEKGAGGHDPAGMYLGIKNNRAFKTIAKDSLFQFSFPHTLLDGYFFIHLDGCEVDPDDFTFSTPDGKSGKFFLENNGEVRTSGSKPYKVDLSGLALLPNNSYVVTAPSTIKITTDDGYTYHFGGSHQYLEIVYHMELGGRIQSADIVAWHLSKIEAPNGRSIVFEYEPYQSGVSEFAPGDPNHFLYTSYTSINWYSGFLPLGPSPVVSTQAYQNEVKEATKTVYLRKIIIDDHTTITFYNNQRERKFYPLDPNPFNQKNLKVDSISVAVSGDPSPVHRFHFNYEYLGGTYPRLFLKSFGEVGIPFYRFDYYDTDNLPDPVTFSVDHWGFWNERQGNRVVPDFFMDPETQELTYISDVREPNPEKLSATLLKRQYYPTGGYTEFIYEPHDYRKRRQRPIVMGKWPELVNMNSQKIAGGARIRTIINHDGIKETNRRDFKYIKTDVYPNFGPSSGIVMNWPQNVFYKPVSGGMHVLVDENNFNISYYPGEAHIQYTDVAEFDASGGCTTYKFTSYEDHPDVRDYSVLREESNDIEHLLLMRPNDHSFERGHPIEVTIYASKTDGSYYPVSKKITSYTEKADNPSAFVIGMFHVALSMNTLQTYKKPYHPFLPKQERQISYTDEGNKYLEVVTDFTYNNHSYLSTQVTRGSNARTKMQRYRYVGDLITNADEAVLFNGSTPTSTYHSLTSDVKALVDMKRNNMLNKAVEVIQYANDVPITAGLLSYKDFANVNASKHVYSSQSWKTVSSMANFTDATIAKTGAWTLNKHISYGSEPVVTVDKVDGIGNPVEMTEQNDAKVSYIWGYNKLYPVAEFVGAPANRVYYTGFEDTESNEATNCRTGSKCLSGSYSKTLSNLPSGSYKLTYWKKTDSGSDWEIVETPVTIAGSSYSISIPAAFRIDDVRFYPADKPVIINTFTYRPQGGMTSKTDSNNVTEFYSFDNLGRLKLIQDADRNIIKSFDYQFQGN